MDWLRRNWVDVLMAGLILAVVGGFLTLLLRGGVFRSNTDTAATNTTPLTTVPAPTTPKPTPQPSTPSSQPVTVKPVQKPAMTTKPRSTMPLGVPEIPEAPINPVVTKPVANTSGTASSITSSSNTTSGSNTTAPSRPTVQTQPSTSSKATPTSPPFKTTGTYTRADFLRNYRVAAGSYTKLERAKKAVVQLRSRGLPAQTFPSGSTHVVVVGPYAQEASARTAFTKVRQVFPDAILYRPDGTKEASARVPKTSTPQGGGNGQPATLSTDSAYLQVGAFKDVKGAAALLTKLKNAGFAPLTKNISGLLRVLVGPLQTNQIQSIRTDLKNQGFEAFQVNL